jgi:hypothetical protein
MGKSSSTRPGGKERTLKEKNCALRSQLLRKAREDQAGFLREKDQTETLQQKGQVRLRLVSVSLSADRREQIADPLVQDQRALAATSSMGRFPLEKVVN